MMTMKKLGIITLVLAMVAVGVLTAKAVSCSEGYFESDVNATGEQAQGVGVPLKVVTEGSETSLGEPIRLVPEGSEAPAGGVPIKLVFVPLETEDLNGVQEAPTELENVHMVEVVSAEQDTTPPGTPTGLTATAVSISQVNLDWDDNPEADLAKYRVYRSTTTGVVLLRASETSWPENTYAVKLVRAGEAEGLEPGEMVNVRLASDHLTPSAILVAETAVSNYSDTGLSASTTYYYKVTAADTSGNESSPSNEASTTTLALDSTPSENKSPE